MNTRQDHELTNQALEQFKQRTGLKLEQRANRTKDPGDLLLTLRAQGITQQFAAEIKRHVNEKALGALLHTLKNQTHKGKGLLLADYINPRLAETLRKLKLPFLDTAGNAFIDEPPVYVYITGNRPRHRITPRTPKPFHAAGLRVLFLFLCRRELATIPFREIARYAGVALGTVGKIIEDLKVRRNLVPLGNQRYKLINTKNLLQEWVMLYPTVLKPKLLIGRYAPPIENWWTNAELPRNALWGGEIAAAKLTNYLQPAHGIVYTYGNPTDIIIKNRLREDANGTIEMFEAFWDRGLQLHPPGTVPPLLVYADLLATGEPRNFEAAQIIYDKEIARLIEQD